MRVPVHDSVVLVLEKATGVSRTELLRDNAATYEHLLRLRGWLREGGAKTPRIRIPRKAKKRYFGTVSRRKKEEERLCG